MKIAIIDCIGLNYDGTTLSKKGIGGSESAIISMSKELVKIGFEVKVFNDCDSTDTKPGMYDGVEYLPVAALGVFDYNFDIVISQRTVIPFTPTHLYPQVCQPAPRNWDPSIFKQVQRGNQLKIVWMQDTFTWGDHLLEQLTLSGHINEIFNLSDWHIHYTTNCDHGSKRQFEVLKDKIFHTRNAINRWIDWVDVSAKDPNLFVYNASITKGMVPLVQKIWPKIRANLPQAKLKIIGGYYQFNNEPLSPAQQQWLDLQNSVSADPSIEFTGIIPQPQIAAIMAAATYNLYPGAYPETSGISTIESVNYNTPIIGTRFGAMAESGTEDACYFMDYAIEPNGLFPWIDTDQQIEKYVQLVIGVVSNPYLHQQKQYACNVIKDVSTWDTVALQWKQHFCHRLDRPLTEEELVRVKWINYRVRDAFARRFTNVEDIVDYAPEVTYQLSQPKKPTVAIFDIVGMAYDGNTLSHKGLGGSESAVILISKELSNLGFDVTIYNGCGEDGCAPGIYDGVIYRPLEDMLSTSLPAYDVVISSRCVTPFIEPNRYNQPQLTHRKIDYSLFEKIRRAAKLKVLWMHDTFCWGDDILEDLVTEGSIDEIWTLSDFHANYVSHCSHPRMRNFEVLREHMWVTRNGITKHFDTVNLDAKDPNLFMFNANMSKGLGPLLNSIWPQVKQRIPAARLVVIGGHYKLGSAFAVNTEESEFEKMVGAHINDPTITFTGIIRQQEVADICARSSYFIYPTQFPETYGISTLEALYANTPLLTCRFGALEETATSYSYYINYSTTKNSVYSNIDEDKQAREFVNMVEAAYNDKSRHRNRMEKLNVIKDIAGWDTVALEWKHHLYSKLGLYLSAAESQQALYSKSKYQRLFGRKTSTREQWQAPQLVPQQKMVIVSPFYNAENYIEKCIASVAAQMYDNFEHWLIDDASTDDSFAKAQAFIETLPTQLQLKFHLVKNQVNQGAVHNHMSVISKLDDSDVVLMLDGDDSLVNSADILTYYNHIHGDYDFTYGSCWSMVDSIPLIAQDYPPHVKEAKQYKQHRFNWNVPYTHLRTMKAGLLKKHPLSKFQDQQGNWYRAGGDLSTFYAAIESCEPHRVKAVPIIMYNYNDVSPTNDYKINQKQQDQTVNAILNNQTKKPVSISSLIFDPARGKLTVPVPEPKELVAPHNIYDVLPTPPVRDKRILIAIPTNKNIEVDTFKSIYDLTIPPGYTVDFQYFWGYQVDQVRNLIAHWAINNGYDYLFAVDSDISFPPDTLQRLLSHDKDVVSGIYIQRIPGQHTIEIMCKNQFGGISHVDWKQISGQGLVPIDGCGFGCALIKIEVFKAIPYPHFVYHSAIDHAHTLSEDVHFCNLAKQYGFHIWADTDVICDHTGSWKFKVDRIPKKSEKDYSTRLRELGNMPLLPQAHIDYLWQLRSYNNVTPRVVYDIGAAVLHWTREAKKVWPEANYYAFDAMDEVAFLYAEHGIPGYLGVLSDQDDKTVEFYQNLEHPGGNSYYRENINHSPNAQVLFSDHHRVKKQTITLDTLIKRNKWPLPDLIKIDVQGSELDILKGATQTLKHCQNLIVELQVVEYNIGAPCAEEVINWLQSQGFVLKAANFVNDPVTGDYHFTKM